MNLIESAIKEYLLDSLDKVISNIFDLIRKQDIEGGEMKYLSMGMSDSYKVAIEEGANLVRIGTKLFGARNYS